MDDDIRDIVRKLHEMELDALPQRAALEERYTLSAAFYQRMERLLGRMKKRNKLGRSLQYLAAAAAVILLLFFTSHPQYIAQAAQNVMEWFGDHVSFRFKDNAGLSSIPEYEPGYVPEGYELVSSDYFANQGVVLYSDGVKDLIFVYLLDDSALNVNSKDAELRTLEQEDGTCIYYFENAEERTYSLMTWLSADETIVFKLEGDLPEEELLKIRSSLMEKEKGMPE